MISIHGAYKGRLNQATCKEGSLIFLSMPGPALASSYITLGGTTSSGRSGHAGGIPMSGGSGLNEPKFAEIIPAVLPYPLSSWFCCNCHARLDSWIYRTGSSERAIRNIGQRTKVGLVRPRPFVRSIGFSERRMTSRDCIGGFTHSLSHPMKREAASFVVQFPLQFSR